MLFSPELVTSKMCMPCSEPIFTTTRNAWLNNCINITLVTKLPSPKMSEKRLAWGQVVKELEQGLKNGKGYELSVIRDNLNSINKNCNFRNRDVKVFLINHFGNEIDFTYPSAVNKSIMVFSVPSDVTCHVTTLVLLIQCRFVQV